MSYIFELVGKMCQSRIGRLILVLLMLCIPASLFLYNTIMTIVYISLIIGSLSLYIIIKLIQWIINGDD